VSLYHNFKSLFGITFLVGVLNVISHVYRARRLRPVTLLAAGVIVAAAYFAATAAYSTLALDGTLGGIAQDSMRRREASSLGFLLSGRSESLISTRAIAESPILGHGSWARDPEYVTRYIEILRARGVRQDTAALVRWGTIPTHSHLLGAWVEAGLLGALFWAYCLALTVRAAAQVTLSGMKGSVVVGFLMILLSWDILFSPYGAERRFYDAAYLVIAVIMLQRLRTRADV
jgi:O-antigen ligase